MLASSRLISSIKTLQQYLFPAIARIPAVVSENNGSIMNQMNIRKKIGGRSTQFLALVFKRVIRPDTSRQPKLRALRIYLHLECQVSDIIIDAAKSTLLIIDLQKFTLSPALRNNLLPDMSKAKEIILKYGIPSIRKAGVFRSWG